MSNSVIIHKIERKVAGTLAPKANSWGLYVDYHKSQRGCKPHLICSAICRLWATLIQHSNEILA